MKIQSRTLRSCTLNAGPEVVEVDGDGRFEVSDGIGQMLVDGIAHEYSQILPPKREGEAAPPPPPPSAVPEDSAAKRLFAAVRDKVMEPVKDEEVPAPENGRHRRKKT